MRYLVLSDIHANLEALEVCLTSGRRHRYNAMLVLGDIVGYGPNPNEVVARIRELDPFAVVRGNHDKVACGLDSADGFNVVAKAAARWTFDALTPDNRAWIAALPTGPIEVDTVVEICHGAPFDEDAYVFDELDAVRALRTSSRPLCLYGHTHYPVAFVQNGPSLEMLTGAAIADCTLPLRPGTRYLVNPGSVGQPRDGDARAAYAIVDTDAPCVEFYRLEYSVDLTQEKIATVGLPKVLADRLIVGK